MNAMELGLEYGVCLGLGKKVVNRAKRHDGLCPGEIPMLLLLLLSRFSRVLLCATPDTAAHQTPRPWDSPGKNTGVGCHFLL